LSKGVAATKSLKGMDAQGIERFGRLVGRNIVAPNHQHFFNFRLDMDVDGEHNTLVELNCIDNGKKIWWDLRPHWQYPTIEFRVCDACTKVDEVLCIAALIQAICAKLLKLRSQNLGFRKYLPTLISENKWRAMRYGIDGKLIDFGKLAEVPMRDLALELLEFVDDVVDELESRKEVEYVHTLLREGTSADRQLRVYEQTGSLQAVIDHLAAETVQGVPPRPVVG